MAGGDSGEARSTISGGTQQGPVLQGRDFHNVHVGDVVQAAAAPVALAQLPGPVAGFTGRGEELARVTALLDPAGEAGPVVVSAVAGLAGVGKTALAIQAAHAARAAGWFGGGVLFIDLHGYDETRVEPGQALDALLRALGISGEHIPAGTEERAGLYRSVLAGIGDPVLIIADNASSEAQVRPVLPGAGPHRVVVTSRHTLAGLGARLLDVTVLDDEPGLALLDAVLRAGRPDDDRISGDLQAAARLVRACGGLPLALRIVVSLLAADQALTAGELAGDLADEIRRLAVLHYDDGSGTSAPSVAAAFELSYRRLDTAAARMFRLLPVNPGLGVSTAAAAVLADLPVSDTRKVIGQLVKAHLAESGAGHRWRMHDLLRLYANQLSDAHAGADGREQARDRLLDYYRDTAAAVEAFAMNWAIEFYSKDWEVEDVHGTKSYDLVCRRGEEIKHVEVKGTTTGGAEVILTPNEVAHARKHPHTALFVVSNITLERAPDGTVTATGGTQHLYDPWHLDDARLTPVRFSYQVPDK